MPSSNEAVATTAGRSPAFRSSSVWRRTSGLRLPWCDRAIGAGGSPSLPSSFSSLSRAVSRSTTRRLFAKTIVDRCDRIRPSSACSIPGQTEADGCGPWNRDGNDTSRSNAFGCPASTIVTGLGSNSPVSARFRRPPRKRGHFFERSLRGRQADPGEPGCQGFKPFQEDRQKNPTFSRGDGVDFIDDEVRHRSQRLACPTCEHQVQRFGRRDENVGRLADDPLPLARGGVPRADGHRQRRERLPELLGGGEDAVERHAEVALHVLVQRLQRRDVEDAHAGRASGVSPQVIQRRQERGERLARPGGGEDQGVLASGDGRPATDLRPGRLAESLAEPVAYGRVKATKGRIRELRHNIRP